MTNWISGAIKHPGSFTKQAMKAGMTVSGFKNKVMSNKSSYSGNTIRRAVLANTLSKLRRKG